MALTSHKKVGAEGILYNDIAFGFKLMQNKIRSARIITKTPLAAITPVLPGGTNCPWSTGANQERLYFVKGDSTNEIRQVFGTCDTGGVRYLVYVPDMDAVVKKADIIFKAPGAGLNRFLVTPNGSASMIIRAEGTKDKVAFDMSSTIWRRLP